MVNRCVVVSAFFAVALSGASVNVTRFFMEGRQLNASDAVTLESAVASNPEDAEKRAQLLGFYAANPAADVSWSNRVRLVSWTVEHHPDSELLVVPGLWQNMPEPMFQQMKPMWIAAVHQNADNPNVLRSAAAFLLSKNVSAIPPDVIRIGGSVAATNLVSKVEPAYPPLAKQARVQGTVRFNVVVGKDGHVENVELVSGHPLLVGSAVEAVEKWVYKPTLLNGNPVRVATTVDVTFSLLP